MSDVRTYLDLTINGGIAVAQGAPLQTSYTQMVTFGASGTDTGYFLTHSSPRQGQYNSAVLAGGGLQTDIGSWINTTELANALGLSAIPVGLPGGTNYAASGATVSSDVNSNSMAPSVVQQINTYLTTAPAQIDQDALFYINPGSNSLTYALGLSTFSAAQDFLIGEAHALSNAMQSLYDRGARNFLVSNGAGGGALGASFRATLFSDLDERHISFVVADERLLTSAISNSPSSYGITNTIQPPAGPFDQDASTPAPAYDSTKGGTINPRPYDNSSGSGIDAGWARFATQENANADTYLWADDQHLGGRAQQAKADYTFNALQTAHPVVGAVLSATPSVALASGDSAPSISYTWQRLTGSQWADITGSSSSPTYTVAALDVSHQLRVVAQGGTQNGHSYNAVSPATQTVVASAVVQAPGPPSLAANSDTGVSNYDNISREIFPTFTGVARPGATVTLTDGGRRILGTASANVVGTWSYELGGQGGNLTEGVHNILVSDSLNGNTNPNLGSRIVTIDTTAPLLTSTSVNGASLTLNYDSPIGTGLPLQITGFDPKPPAGSFSVSVDGGSDTVSTVAVNTTAQTVTLTLATAVAANQIVTVAYTAPTGTNSRRAIQDIAGNNAANFSGFSVTNNTSASGGGGGGGTSSGGTSGPDSIAGTSGNDVIDSGDGADTILAGQGSDTVTAGDGGNIIVGGDDSNDGPDQITSGSGNDLIFGNGGDDTISSSGGNDVVVGGVGDDLITLGAGNDIIYGNENNDTISAGDGDNIVAAGQGDDQVSAGAGADLIFGNEGADMINAGDGDNTIVGGQDSTDAADVLGAGSGNDLIFGNGGDDTIGGGDGRNALVGGFGNDSITAGAGDDIVYGNQDDDVIDAGGGANLIFGGMGDDLVVTGSGNDTLYGNEGNDTLTGGAGADRYVFNAADGSDVVQGFSSADGDLLDLQGQTYVVSQDGQGSAVLTLSGGGMITLASVAVSQVDAGFFA